MTKLGPESDGSLPEDCHGAVYEPVPGAASWADPFDGYPFASAAVAGNAAARALLRPLNPSEFTALAGPADPWTGHEVDELIRFNEAAGNGAASTLAREATTGGALVVVTGQQPNLLAAPVYNLLKAATAIALARRLEADTGRRVVPVFWVASDDDDFLELRECHILCNARLANLGDLVGRAPEAPAGSPAYAWSLAASAPRLLDAAGRISRTGPAGRQTMETYTSALAGEPTFESAFCRLLVSYLGDGAMLLLAPRLSGIRRRLAPVLQFDLDEPGLVPAVLGERARALEAAGFTGPLTRTPDQVNAFLLIDGVRHRLRRDGAAVAAIHPATGKETTRLTSDQLTQLAAQEPARLIPNVVTRPLVQNRAFAVAAYVGGPGEIAYLAQLDPLYDQMASRPAAIVPRASATLLPAVLASRIEEAAGAPAGGLDRDPAGTVGALLASDKDFGPLLREAAVLEAALEAGLERMRSLQASRRPAVQGALQKTARAQRRSLERLRSRLSRQLSASGGPSGDALAAFAAWTRPRGLPQERILAPLSLGCLLTPREIGDTIINSVHNQPAGHRWIRIG